MDQVQRSLEITVKTTLQLVSCKLLVDSLYWLKMLCVVLESFVVLLTVHTTS